MGSDSPKTSNIPGYLTSRENLGLQSKCRACQHTNGNKHKPPVKQTERTRKRRKKEERSLIALLFKDQLSKSWHATLSFSDLTSDKSEESRGDTEPHTENRGFFFHHSWLMAPSCCLNAHLSRKLQMQNSHLDVILVLSDVPTYPLPSQT